MRDIAESGAFYRDQLGFTLHVEEDGFAILQHGPVDIHLWAANDESWRERRPAAPIVPGAESFIAGTTSCRIGSKAWTTFIETLSRAASYLPTDT